MKILHEILNCMRAVTLNSEFSLGGLTSGCPEDHSAYTHPYLFRHGKSPVLSLRTILAILGADVFVTRFLLLHASQHHDCRFMDQTYWL